MKLSYAMKCAALILASAIGILPAMGQEDKSKPSKITVKVDLVSLTVTVTDQKGRSITGLGLDEFLAFEYTGHRPGKGDQVEIEKVVATERPASICIVADTSGSIGGKLPALREALAQFMKTSNPLDEFCLIDFVDGHAQILSDFPETSGVGNADQVIQNLVFLASKGETPLFDGIYRGIGLLEKRELMERDNIKMLQKQQATPEEIEKHSKKRILLIVSDGGDNHSLYNENDVKRAIEESDVQIYAIGIFDPPSARGRTPEELRGPTLLQELTEMKGGRVFVVETSKDLEDVALKVSAELRTQYILYYRPIKDAAHKGGKTDKSGRVWKKVQVRVRPPKGMPPLTAKTRDGYYSTDNK